MAKIKLTGGFKPLAEGVYIFKVTEAEFKEEFGKLSCTLETEKGEKVFNNYNFGAKGENEKSINAFSFFAHKVLNDPTADEIDHTDLIGKFVQAEVVHTTGNDGKVYSNVKNFESSDGWVTVEDVEIIGDKDLKQISDDLDDILGD